MQLPEVSQAAIIDLEKELGDKKLSDGSDLEAEADVEYHEAINQCGDREYVPRILGNEKESGAVRLQRTGCELFAIGQMKKVGDLVT